MRNICKNVVAVLALSGWAITSLSAQSQSHVVARYGKLEILREAIACNRSAVNKLSRPADETLDAFCHRLEQQELDRRLIRAILDRAGPKYHLEPQPQEIDQAIPREVNIEGIAKRQRTMAEALLRVMRGADLPAVERQELLPESISVSEFDAFRNSFQTPEQVEGFLRQDNAALMRRSIQQQKRWEIITARLADRARALAAKTNRPVEQAASEIWRELTDGPEGVIILDSSFSRPDIKGVFTR